MWGEVRKIFPEWYEKRAEIRYINQFNKKIDNLTTDFNNENNLNQSSIVTLTKMLEELTKLKDELQNRNKQLICQYELENMVNRFISTVNNELFKLQLPSSLQMINMMGSFESDYEESYQNRQSLMYY